MGLYRAADLVTVPGMLSLARIPLGAAFPFVVDRPAVAFGVLVGAAITDVLDGWWARTFNRATATGAVLDPVTDKLFVAAVVGTLVVTGALSPLAILLLSTREVGELPLVVYLATNRSARKRRAEQPKANLPGKVATVLQFGCVGVAILHQSILGALLWITGAAGVFAATSYWVRALGGREG
ncbi:CDP-alcohol phosphatidyltransferase family protein [Pendulispora albinea]|uniref:CDP-diacylglycerol--glycerol-3-phosphate 3-phosphatidyltransferase n=1 Tax=Pendulispora albinea TaxID=2741071 RepID=A0ABZ2LP53_9BACT